MRSSSGQELDDDLVGWEFWDADWGDILDDSEDFEDRLCSLLDVAESDLWDVAVSVLCSFRIWRIIYWIKNNRK